MEEQGLSKNFKNNSGFTLLELLIAMIIVSVALLGLLRGIVEYNKFAIRAKMKDRATEIAKNFASYIESLPYVEDGNGPSILYANNSNWRNITCDSTSCDIITDENFYSTDNLRLYPDSRNADMQCLCRGPNCPTNLPVCIYEGFSNKRVYAGINVARIVESGSEVGKVVSVIVWYTEPFTNKEQKISTVIIKEKR